MKRYSDRQVLDMLSASYEMATVGYFGQKVGDTRYQTGFKVLATSDGYPQSHIHIILRGSKEKRICVKLTKCSYFSHTSWLDKFTTEEARQFNAFLSNSYKYPQTFIIGNKKFKVTTYWEYAIYQWKLENDGLSDNLLLDTDSEGFVQFPSQPDYTTLT